MHYVGNLGITNYSLAYDRVYLAASFIIAIGDCLGVLVLFYTWRDKWISALWKRLFCAFFLAGGVSAMHFTASVGCSYRFKSLNQPGALQSSNIQVIVASVLCGTAALVVLGALFLTRYRVWLRRQRAKKVMLVCAAFDQDGRILVTTEGVLPAHEITDSYNAANFSETFDTAHLVFHWLFRVTYNWTSVAELIPRMRSHAGHARAEIDDHSLPSSSSSSGNYDPSTYTDYTVIFRERFCVAASSLAASLHIPLDKIGVLYDKIIETGTFAKDERLRRSRFQDDIEMGMRKMMVFGRGQALMLVSQMGAEDSDKLLNAGYKFATIQNVGRTIADSLQIPVEVVEAHCNGLLRYITNLRLLDKPGTWLAFFAPVPVPHTNGFDVAVSKLDQNQLPDAQIQQDQPTLWQHQLLMGLDGKRTAACIRHLDNLHRNPRCDVRERHFAITVLAAFRRLSNRIPKEWWAEAHFYAKPLAAPYSRVLAYNAMPTALYALVVMGDAHTVTEKCESITKVPLSFFSLRQRCFKGSRDHQIMSRAIHQEFGAILGRKAPAGSMSSRLRLPGSRRNNKGARTPIEKVTTPTSRDDSFTSPIPSSDHGVELTKAPDSVVTDAASGPDSRDDPAERGTMYGGILVNSETVICTDSEGELTAGSAGSAGGAAAGLSLGMVADASRERQEDTFADELLHVARNRFMPPKPAF